MNREVLRFSKPSEKLKQQSAKIGAIAALGCISLLTIGQISETETNIGPVETTVSLGVGTSGETKIDLGPFGVVGLDTHDGPLRIDIDAGTINVNETEQLINQVKGSSASVDVGAEIEKMINEDVAEAERKVIIKTGTGLLTMGLVAGSILLARADKRDKKKWVEAGALSLVPLVTAAALATSAVATQHNDALERPKYSGPIEYAPGVLSGLQDISGRYEDYSQQIAKQTENVVKLYQTGETLPVLPDGNYLEIMTVSDIHCNEGVFESIKTAAQALKVNMIIDAGDITDYGSSAESFCYKPVETLDLPYYFVKGNHDSPTTVSDLSKFNNVTILNGQIETAEGINIVGIGDPRLESSPTSNDDDPRVAEMGKVLVSIAENNTIDIAVKHDSSGTEELAGKVDLVISGHMHERSAKTVDGTLFYTEGTTGGAGTRAFDHGEEITDKPTEQTASIFYWDIDNKRFVAVEQLTLGGLGTNSVSVKRCSITTENELNC